MPRNPPPRQPQGPILSPEQARIKLQRSIDKGRELLQKQPFSEERYDVWYTSAFKALEETFGENSGHLYKFKGQPRVSVSWNPQNYQANENRTRLGKEISILEALIEELPESDDQDQSTRSDFFGDLDTDIRRVSQELFGNGHYADSVSAAFKELNHQVKQEYKRRKNVELDGADLMRQAFSPKNPVFVLADQSNESGRNIQQGFMELFAGAMIGIRNPHAHENLVLNSDDAKHFVYLASLLMKKFKTVR